MHLLVIGLHPPGPPSEGPKALSDFKVLASLGDLREAACTQKAQEKSSATTVDRLLCGVGHVTGTCGLSVVP